MKRRGLVRREIRGNPFFKEWVPDPYRAQGKPRAPARCPNCGVQFRAGRWRWAETAPRGLRAVDCPACRRIEAHDPAGELVLSGRFLSEHRDEILATVKHVESLESREHPLNRIMSIDERDGDMLICTTDIHLPHRIGHAIRNAWGGSTRTHYDLEGYFTRVRWTRDD